MCMENITIGQVAAAVAFLVALGVGFKTIKGWTVAAIKAAVKEELGQLSGEIKELHTELKKEDKEKKQKDILHISLQLKNEDMAEFTCDKEVVMRNQ